MKTLSTNIKEISRSLKDASSNTDTENTSKHEPKVVVSMLYCLCDWLLSESTTHSLISVENSPPEARPAILLSDEEVNTKVFSAIEAALMGRVKYRVDGTGREMNHWPAKR